MPEYSSSGRDPRRNATQRNTRSAARPGSAPRSGSARPAGSRPASSRPNSARPQSARPAGSRPQQGRRPAPRRKKRTQPRFFIILAILAVLVVALILIFGGKGGKDTSQPPVATTAAPAAAAAPADPNAPAASAGQSGDQGALALWLEQEDSDSSVAPAQIEMVPVEDLSINTALPSDWINILLMGTDERFLNERSRTDAMLICSINPSTGEVKLTSLMRDTAVVFDDLGQYNGTYRINSANYFGGPEYAIKTVNECFGMNIQYYVMVNFFGFQKIAEALGGIELDITEAEMEQINHNAVEQAWAGYYAGVDESDQVNEYLTTFGPNTHLNGRQTLAYARIRHTDSDFTRAERQRKVLIKLLEKLKTRSVGDLILLAGSLSDCVTTNMDINAIIEIATQVMQSGISNVETLRLPENNTYTLDRRNEHEMLYDVDWATNSRILYDFIYE